MRCATLPWLKVGVNNLDQNVVYRYFCPMTSTPPLGEIDLTYIRIALKRLADEYESLDETDAAEKTRALLQRVEDRPPASGMTRERQAYHQKRLIQTMGQNVGAVANVISEWYAELLLLDPKAHEKLADMLVKQVQSASSHASLMTLHRAGTKLEALEKRHGTSVALQQFGEWIVVGFAQLKEGEPPWPGDPDLTAP